MKRLRSKLNPEAREFAIEGPTGYKTERNVHQLHCSECGALYYVDEQTLQQATTALEGDPSEIAFYCDECEEQYQEEGHTR